ncbi:hypothetical protein, partial [Mesorhizobium sp.]|uniref:hypothetical protein n=1 Tax=Mesorhizobium sp. TaxID=1871066 RepID=UPI0025BA3184
NLQNKTPPKIDGVRQQSDPRREARVCCLGAGGAAAVLKHCRRTTTVPQHGEDRFNEEDWHSAGISAKETARRSFGNG